MFLLVSGRHVGAHLGGHQHCVSIQISINLGKTFLRISPIRKIAVTWILARVFAYLPSFYFQILDLIYWTVLIFYFDLFWMAWHWKPAIVSTKWCRTNPAGKIGCYRKLIARLTQSNVLQCFRNSVLREIKNGEMMKPTMAIPRLTRLAWLARRGKWGHLQQRCWLVDRGGREF